MAAHLGAHEVMEVHEILTETINATNHFQLLRPYVQDQHLAQLLDHQLQFMTQEYNSTVQMLHQQGAGQAVTYQSPRNIQPMYGLDHPAQERPVSGINELNDRDVASAMLGCHKASAAKKMMGALECANPQLRHTLQQGAINCAEQAYEVWGYMNQRGYYQVPTMKEVTTDTVLSTYAPTGPMQMQANQQMQPNQPMRQFNMQ